MGYVFIEYINIFQMISETIMIGNWFVNLKITVCTAQEFNFVTRAFKL